MLVSVIVPNYNHARFLERRLQSILNQTYRNFEIIILDDHSTDNSYEIIEQYRTNPHVSKIIYNEVNSGSAFHQWRKGLSLAKGELIWIAESDDWCENNFLETLVAGTEKKPSLVVAFSQSYCVDDNNVIKWQSNHEKMEEYVAGKKFFKERLVYGCTIFNASMAIFKKEAALKVPVDYTNFKLCGDWFFWINVVCAGDVFISNKVLNYYRRSHNSLTEKLYKGGFNFMEELKMFRIIKSQKIYDASMINNSVFNRYNSFKKRKGNYTANEANQIEKAFYEFFGGGLSFRFFLAYKQLRLLIRKLGSRIKLAVENRRPYKAETI